uniref:Adrenomedullin 2 n=1 Tax=Neogobius melanostomus TaxID=47308 RepID=A0A8C6TJ40_9GOBI
MRSFPALLTACCISLLSQQLLALRAEERVEERRLELIDRLFDVSEDAAPPATAAPALLSKWPRSLPRRRPTTAGDARPIPPSLSWAYPSSSSAASPPLQLLRWRRHLSSRKTHQHQAQLMRVGCVLGTCQVQNLSHRLYQLIGQSGREESSPINPKSPHSYG